ncbi:hypothetical protein BGZ73_007564 [Actinomortierella ambigua]|nr:hypothetical protein BGZ73_007564 [Actinomortierella ambigua]
MPAIARALSTTPPTTPGTPTTDPITSAAAAPPALPANYPTPRPFPHPSDPSARPLVCLGIETSCDDTCAAIVTSDRQILSEVLRTQHHLHEPMGGIVPKLAHHAHMQQLPGAIREAIQAAQLPNGLADIDVIAVTRGPGLAHSLGVGLNAAKSLAAALDRPLIGVHHMEAHALTARLTTMPTEMGSQQTLLEEEEEEEGDEADLDKVLRLQAVTPTPPFPFLTLLVSGGHTLLLVAHSVDRYSTLATTVDNSIGEVFDKAARELAIPWLPGRSGGPGASLEAWAKQSRQPERFVSRLPIPMRLRDSKYEMKFSFAGLRSAITRVAAECREKQDEDRDAWTQDLAAAFQYCAVTHLCNKVEQGLEWCHEQGMDISSLVISGGVGRNVYLRSRMEGVCAKFEFKGQEAGGADLSKAEKKKLKKAAAAAAASGEEPSLAAKSPRRSVQVICPPLKLCTDNAVMIAWTGIERYREGLFDPYDIDIIPKWPLDMLGTGKIPE